MRGKGNNTAKRLIPKMIVRYPNGGMVIKYNTGDYNSGDIKDLEEIAMIKARKERSRIEILPKVDADNPLYSKLYSDLKSTIYERKCPDLRVSSVKGGKRYVEYESFARPFRPRDLSRMINRGSKQAASLIIDIRDTNITENYVRRQVWKNLSDPDFHRPIKRIWT